VLDLFVEIVYNDLNKAKKVGNTGPSIQLVNPPLKKIGPCQNYFIEFCS